MDDYDMGYTKNDISSKELMIDGGDSQVPMHPNGRILTQGDSPNDMQGTCTHHQRGSAAANLVAAVSHTQLSFCLASLNNALYYYFIIWLLDLIIYIMNFSLIWWLSYVVQGCAAFQEAVCRLILGPHLRHT